MLKKSIVWSSRTAWALVVGGTWLGVSGLTGMPISGASQFGAARAQAFENGASESAAPDNEASTKTNSDGGSLRQAPRALKPGDRGVGRQAGDGAWVDLDGKRGRVSELTGKPGQLTVFAWTSTSCPLSKKYLPVLSRLEQQFAPRGVKFVLVNPVASDSVDSMREARKSHAFQAAYLKDADGAVSKALGATTTTDVVVLDAARTVVYHGAVDDQYGLGYSMEQARHAYLSDALNELLAGKTPRIAATDAPGCTLEWAESESSAAKNDAAASSVTYHNRISRIVNQYCVECHRAGGLAPFSLTSRADLLSHQGMIKQVVERRVMPPWFAAPTASGEATRWSNDRSLADADKRDLLAWFAAGAPEGDQSDAPLQKVFPKDWMIGEPDVVLQLPREVSVKAEGTMPYQNLIVPTNFGEDRWVVAAEVQPTAREVVHHVLVFVVGGEGAVEREPDDERRGYLVAYVPGNSFFSYPEGFAKRLPKGAKLMFQMHYTPNGKATTDRTRVALKFAKEPPKHEVKVAAIANTRIRIPPGAENHADGATLRVPADVQLLAFFPHMHLRGKAFRYEVTKAGGGAETLLDVPRYDFNWQLPYRLAEPQPLAAGSTIKITGWFDNSEKNPANPDPKRTVTWGPQTFDEMLLGYIEYYVTDAQPGEASSKGERRPVAAQLADRLRDRGLELMFKQADKDSDGKMSREEAKAQFGANARYKDNPALLDQHFRKLDADNDGSVTPEEFSKVRELLGR